MKMRSGQAVLYLVMVLLALAVLMFANVNVFLAVRSKNRMMNAVDEAAIAAAKWQGELLNEIGRLNVEHLRAAVLGEDWVDEQGHDKTPELHRLSFLKPLEGIARANDAARDWGFEGGADPEALAGFLDHLSEIRNNPEFYPREDPDLWGLYAAEFARSLGGNPAVLPRFMEVVNPGVSGLFASGAFYDVLVAKAWCWFTIGNRSAYLDMDPGQVEMPEITPVEAPENSEVFSLHVTFKGWMDSEWAEEYVSGVGFSERWTNFVCRVTGLAPEEFSPKSKVLDPDQVWAFYDGNWSAWSPTFNPDELPLAGPLKPEYDVAGCVASCMMLGDIQQIEDAENGTSGVARRMLVTADAKPVGTVRGLDGGGVAPVTAYRRFVAASSPGERIFTEAALVLVDTVPHASGVSMEPGWYEHVKKHSPQSPEPCGCEYCRLWAQWSEPSFRTSIREWLNANSETCRPKGGGGPAQKGGYRYAH